MDRLTWRGWLALGPLLAVGCAGATQTPTGDAHAQAIAAATLPDLPGCGAVSSAGAAHLTARPIAGERDLYLVNADGRPLCVDSSSGIEALSSNVLFAIVDSNPMPGRGSSNPMPGVDPNAGSSAPGPASSNPMPGQASSNPMPGSDR
jgi:hypothetical protein